MFVFKIIYAIITLYPKHLTSKYWLIFYMENFYNMGTNKKNGFPEGSVQQREADHI